MYKHILVPTDGSPLSRAAALPAVKLAQAVGARVTALFAAPAATPLAYRGLLPVGFSTPKKNAAMIEKAARAVSRSDRTRGRGGRGALPVSSCHQRFPGRHDPRGRKEATSAT